MSSSSFSLTAVGLGAVLAVTSIACLVLLALDVDRSKNDVTNFATIIEQNDALAGACGTYNESDPNCDDAKECTLDRRETTRNTCEHEFFSKSQTCTSVCYAPDSVAHCDGKGGCVGDNASNCLATCDMINDGIWSTSCGTMWNFVFPYSQTTNDGWITSGWDYYGVCYGNNCVGYFGLITAQNRGVNNNPNQLDYFDCFDFLDPVYHREQINAGCLRTEKVYVGDNYTNEPHTGGTYSLSTCIYHFECGYTNGTVITEYGVPVKKRDLIETTLPTHGIARALNKGHLPAPGSVHEQVTREIVMHMDKRMRAKLVTL